MCKMQISFYMQSAFTLECVKLGDQDYNPKEEGLTLLFIFWPIWMFPPSIYIMPQMHEASRAA